MLSISSKFGFTFPKIFKTFVVAVTSKKLQSYSTKNIALVDYLDQNTLAAGVKNYKSFLHNFVNIRTWLFLYAISLIDSTSKKECDLDKKDSNLEEQSLLVLCEAILVVRTVTRFTDIKLV